MTTSIDRREFLIATGITAGLAATGTGCTRDTPSTVRVVGLKSDYLDRPMGLENRRPRLSWRLESERRDVRQTAYRILVASSEAVLEKGRGDLWDSGRVESRKSIGIPYQGGELGSRQRCWWCVQVWDEAGAVSEISAASWWEMGLLEPSDWVAQWLAVEDAVARADRETGLHWVWGDPAVDKRSRKFRYSFELPAAAAGGELIAVVNDWYWWTQITRIWIDGEPTAGPGVWVDPFDRKAVRPAEDLARLSSQQLPLAALSAGKHVIAVEVTTSAGSSAHAMFENLHEGGHVTALALFVRVQLQNGATVRFGEDLRCRTSLTAEKRWFASGYDDRSWSEARAAGLQGYQPWPARPAMYLRREFSLNKLVAHARLYATALGSYEARLNGQRVSDALLTPEASQYAKRVLYRVFDVTALLRQGDNALGLLVGDGWYADFDGRFSWAPPPRRVLAQLELTFADGSRQILSSGPGWRIAQSPILASEIKNGEIYDARLEQPGWDQPGFAEQKWERAEVGPVPACRVVAQVSPPIRAKQTFKPRAISEPRPGVFVADFGENFSGWCRLHARGGPGSRVELRFAELLKPSGEIDQAPSTTDPFGMPRRDLWTLRGDPAGETFEPHFTYRGFRYVEISGLQGAPDVDSVTGVFVHSDLPVTGRIRSDVTLIEQLARNILQTQKTNFVGIPTDNAMREQRGWMNDATACVWDAASFNMDVCAFTTRFMDNVVDDQAADGAFPMVTPEPRHNNAWYHISGSPPAWGDTGIILPWRVWRRYGDLSIIERNWAPMNRHLQFILDHNPDLVWRNKRSNDFGDWLEGSGMNPPGSTPATPKDLLGTAYWAYSAELLAQMAEAIGRQEDMKRLRALFERVRAAFNQNFLKEDGTVGTGSQGGYVLALQFDLLPARARAAAVQRLVADIRSRGPALTTGTVATQFVLDVLVREGFSELAYDLLLKTDYPSWGYMIGQGATTIWEKWDGSSSRNQLAFGSIGGFLFRQIAGIEAAAPGFSTIVIRPVLDRRVRRGGGDYDSVMGRIATDWEQTADGELKLQATIPPNASARVHLPARKQQKIAESRRSIADRTDLQLLSRSAEEAVIEIGSGTYHFAVTG